jgi:hypothetical protein
VAIFAYGEIPRDERNSLLGGIAADAVAEHGLLGVVCIGVSAYKPNYPYDVLVYLPREQVDRSKNAPEASAPIIPGSATPI